MGVCTLKDFNQPGPEVCFAFDVWKYKGPIGFNLVESRSVGRNFQRKNLRKKCTYRSFFLHRACGKGASMHALHTIERYTLLIVAYLFCRHITLPSEFEGALWHGCLVL